MKKSLLITLILFFMGILPSYSYIDIVYPTTKETTISSDETFFTGSVDKNSKLKINSEVVPLWQNSFFVHMVPLKYGKNTIKIERTLDGQTEVLSYIVNRPQPTKEEKKDTKANDGFSEIKDGILYAKTIKDDATIRQKPSIKGKRVLDIPSGIILYLEGKKGEFYKIKELGESEFWIHESNLSRPVKVTQKMLATIKKHSMSEDDFYIYHKFYTSHPVLYTFEQKNKSLKLFLHGVKDESQSNNYVYEFDLGHNLFGFEGYYEDNNFIVKLRKPPIVKDERFPLKDIKIFIDAGHGGTEKGCIGPDRMLEKDINLDIARKVVAMLEEEEFANVTFSRFYDEDVDLYDRVKMAKSDDAFISLSIHSNSLPYGKNPYKTHGTEVHYYNLNSQDLSKIIANNLAKDLGLKNNGIHISSFVLTRSTNPISLLVEVAYMIHPSEYILLKDDEFRTNVAKSLIKSLKQYILFIKK